MWVFGKELVRAKLVVERNKLLVVWVAMVEQIVLAGLYGLELVLVTAFDYNSLFGGLPTLG